MPLEPAERRISIIDRIFDCAEKMIMAILLGLDEEFLPEILSLDFRQPQASDLSQH